MITTIQRLQDNIRLLKETLPLFTEAALSKRPAPGKWSKKEILGHLIDSARYNLQRFTEAPLKEDGAYSVQTYPQDELVIANNYQGMLIEEIVLLWQSLNNQICHALAQIPENALNHHLLIGNDSKSLQWLIEDYVSHMEHHLKQILEDRLPALDIHKFHLNTMDAINGLAQSTTEFITLLKNHDLEVEYYAPIGVDKQHPHDKDELYIIASGKSGFLLEGQRVEVNAHDVLFVPAGKEHRFVDFSEDFAAWVVFWGIAKI